MQCRDQASTTDDEINAAIDSILEEDRQEKLARDRKRKLNERPRCEEPQERDRTKKRSCPKPPKPCITRHVGVNLSKRFSLRVMEAIRAIERQKESGCASACEIVDYVRCNFASDGDVDAQVRTALQRTCCQGFVKNEGNDSYSLVGPLACRLTKTQKANANKSMPSESRCGNKRSPPRSPPRRRSPGCRSPSGRRRNDTKKSSETELSIPTSVEEDINRERVQREISNVQRNEASRNAAIDLSGEQRLRSPRRNDNLEFQRSAVGAAADPEVSLIRRGQSTPRQQSPAREENDLVGAARNLDINFAADSDDDESFDVPDEEQAQPPNPDNDNEDDEEEEEEEDAASDDSALHEIRGRGAEEARQPIGNERDRELRRWIRNCRKECAKRAARGDLRIPDE